MLSAPELLTQITQLKTLVEALQTLVKAQEKRIDLQKQLSDEKEKLYNTTLTLINENNTLIADQEREIEALSQHNEELTQRLGDWEQSFLELYRRNESTIDYVEGALRGVSHDLSQPSLQFCELSPNEMNPMDTMDTQSRTSTSPVLRFQFFCPPKTSNEGVHLKEMKAYFSEYPSYIS